MDCKKIIQRVFSFVLAWVIIFNYCDLEVFDWFGGLTDAEAAIDVAGKWDKKKEELNSSDDGKWITDANKPDKEGFWAKKSEMSKVYEIESSVETSTVSGAVGARIVSDGSAEKKAITKDNIRDVTVERERTDDDAYDGVTRDENYTTDGLYYTLENAESGLGWYRRYYVSTANQLNTILYYYGSSTRVAKLKTTGTKIDSKKIDTTDPGTNEVGVFNNKLTSGHIVAAKVAITLLCDIDLGGADDKNWTGYPNTNVYLEIDGDGHTLYNFYGGGSNYFLGSKDKKFEIKNLTFKRCFLTQVRGIFGTGVQYAYFNNVDWKDCVSVSSGYTTIVLGDEYLYCYFKNCSISNSYAVGDNSSAGHCGLFASFNGDDVRNIAKSTYLEDSSADFTSYYHTNVPSMEEFERAANGNKKSSLAGYEDKTLSKYFPSIYENCSTIGSNVYQLKTTATTYHSGVFVSCIRGGVIFKNCYANGSIFASSQIGGFIGGILGIVKGFNYPDPETIGNTVLLTAYFENCYSTGTVEGIQQLGGFIGIINNDQRATYETRFEAFPSTAYKGSGGYAIFNNCYTTSSVGMEYSGKYLGGFVGLFRGRCNVYIDENDTDKGLETITVKHRFINCYAAGEVGGIDTDVSTSGDESNINKNSIGGFLGMYRPEDFADEETGIIDTSGIMTNCYYDKQTTGMRERDIGSMICEDGSGNLTKEDNGTEIVKANNNTNHLLENELKYGYFKSLSGSLTGLTGVYTQKSDVQNVKGLTDNVNMNDDAAWEYKKGYYPQLNVFCNPDKDAFGSEEKAELAKLNSQASTATVFLKHWDEIMGPDGEDTNDTNAKAYDTVRDISARFTFTSEKNSDGGYLGWEVDTEKNDEDKLTAYMGQKYNKNINNGTDEPDKDNYIYEDNYGDEKKEIKITYDKPEVLVISATTSDEDEEMGQTDNSEIATVSDDGETSDNKYVFKCFNYAAGKQFVKVTTCSKNAYKNWKTKQAEYDAYKKAYNQFEVDMATYSSLLNCEKSVDVINEKRIEKIKECINTTDENLKNDLAEVLDLFEKFDKNSKDDDVKQALIEKLIFSEEKDSYTVNEITVNEYLLKTIKEPLTEPTAVDKPEKFEEIVNAYNDSADDDSAAEKQVASRIFRLIPTAYLNVGDMIKVNVMRNGDNYENTVMLSTNTGETQLTHFDHTIGVVYVSTQGLPLWVGADNVNQTLTTRLNDNSLSNTNNNYVNQTIAKRDDYYNSSETVAKRFDNSGMNTANIFALYSYYPSRYTKDPTDGLTSLTEKISLGNFYPSGRKTTDELDNSPTMGQTIIKVYEADIGEKNGENVATKKVDETTNEPVNLLKDKSANDDVVKKWAGEEPFETDDDGYYFIEYYWRYTDGRYLTQTRLVQIDASSYTLEMCTGVADATADSFTGDGKKTEIDCNVLNGTKKVYKDKTENEIYGINDEDFPSYKYSGTTDEDWDEYVGDTYNKYNTILTYPQNANGVKYWAKSVKYTTNEGVMTVAWRKNGKYSLVKLIVQVRKDGSKYTNDEDGWENMTVVNFEDDGTPVLDNQGLRYQYTYDSYTVLQDSETKAFSVVKTPNSIREFNVLDGTLESATFKYINFEFYNSSVGQSMVKLKDDIRVYALFKTVAAEVDVKKFVYIDDNKAGNVGEGDNIVDLATADEMRSVDNASFEEEDQRAVLFGDKLIYRMRVQNNGIYNANNVVVTDTVPDGCTLVDGSIKVLRQKKVIDKLQANDTYEELENNGSVTTSTVDELSQNYDIENYVYRVDGDKITWVLNPVQMDYDYYLEYEVTVNSKYNKLEELITNTADFTYTYINGDILGNLVNDDSVVLGYHNEKYSQNAIFKATSDEVVGTDGKFKYVVEFVGQDSRVGDYAIEQIVNDIPTGYQLDGDVTVEYSNGSALSDVKIDTTSYSGGFIIEPTNSLKIEKGSGIKLTFTVKPESGATLPEKRVNHSSIVYNQNDEKNVYSSEVTKIDSQTNEVETAVRWLYLNLEKQIPVEDKLQAFMFKVANGDTTLYTEIYADTQDSETTKGEDGTETKTSYYKGNKVIQITKRGKYTISENDWASTDYDMDKASYKYEDITIEDENLKTDDIDSSTSGQISMYIPRAMYESTAFPLWATDEEGNVYPTVTCTNVPSDYAWLSSQRGVENSLNIGATTTTTTSSKANSSKTRVPKTTDEVATPQAVGTNGLKIENDDEDEEEN